MTYEQGYEDGLEDAHYNLQASSSRLWPRDYRYGYSDGFNDGRAAEKLW